MKFLIGFCFLFILISGVYAAEVDVNSFQETYSRGTSFQAEINVNSFLYEDISSNKISFFLDDTKIDVVPLLKKINDNKYFLYFKLPNNLEEGTYNLILKDLVYDSNGVLIVKDVTKEVNIVNNLNNTFYVEPAFILIDSLESQYSTDMELLHSSGGLSEIQITSNNPYCYVSENKINLISGDVKDFNVKIDSLIDTTNENYLTIANTGLSYKIPIYFSSNTQVNNLTDSEMDSTVDVKFNIGISKYKDVLVVNDKLDNKELKIKNFGSVGVENINLNLDGNISKIITLKNDKISFLNSESESIVKIDISAIETGEYTGNIILSNNNGVLDKLQMDIIVVQNSNEKEVILNQNSNDNETKIEDNKTNSNNYFIIGFFAFILVLVIVYLIYRRKTTLPS